MWPTFVLQDTVSLSLLQMTKGPYEQQLYGPSKESFDYLSDKKTIHGGIISTLCLMRCLKNEKKECASYPVFMGIFYSDYQMQLDMNTCHLTIHNRNIFVVVSPFIALYQATQAVAQSATQRGASKTAPSKKKVYTVGKISI